VEKYRLVITCPALAGLSETKATMDRANLSVTSLPPQVSAGKYHPDHLGSTSYITDATGEVYQHLEYFAFGETFVEEQGNTDKMPYKFNGKELDEETGLYYYGARYYDAQTSVWLSVDPLMEKYPSTSAFAYVANNPVNTVDPDGRLIIFIGGLRLAQGARDQAGAPYNGMGGKPGIYNSDVTNYWSTSSNSFGRESNISGFFSKYYDDKNTVFTSGSSYWNSQASGRKQEGIAKAKLFHEGVKNGDIQLESGESIRIVSHSQGGAHASGFAEQLMSYQDADGNALYNVEVIHYITPHQPKDITHPDGPLGIQYSHPNDAISSDSPFWLLNGGTEYGEIGNIDHFFGGDIFGGKGQPEVSWPSPTGNRGGHNVTDNDRFIWKSLGSIDD